MKAMVLAAGLGTRLKPLTNNKPKALVEIGGKPLIAHVLEKMVASGFNHIVINVHHFAEQLSGYIKSNDFDADIYISDETHKLLNTGGGILNAKNFLKGDEPFLVHNVDIFSNINLKELMQFHAKMNPMATLAVGNRSSSRKFLFDKKMQLVGWRNLKTREAIYTRSSKKNFNELAFTGIHVVSPAFFSHVNMKGAFSIVDAYLTLCKQHKLIGYDTSSNYILDVGKVESIDEAKDLLQRHDL
ncbi:MAG: nucleotidyltransferase family protein [Bacteroidales bacterium]